MRRKDREVTDDGTIDEIIRSAHCLRLGLVDNGIAYIVPMSFGFENREGKRIFYFHSAKEGRKLALLRSCARVSFELDTKYCLQTAQTACGYTAKFQSVMGTGKAFFILSAEEKKQALTLLMRHYSDKKDLPFSAEALEKVTVFRLEAEEISCKWHR